MILKQISEDDILKIGRLLSSPTGKGVLEILNKTFYNTISFTPGHPDVSAFKEGQRDLVQVLRNSVKAAENHDRRVENE